MKNSLSHRVNELKSQSVDELNNLPEYSDCEILVGGKKFTLATWRKPVQVGEVQIVVQAYHHHLLGIGTMMADGFVYTKDGHVQPLPENVRLEYC